MKIANIMFGKKRGGIEQAAVDYSRALASRGHDCTAIVREGAAIAPLLAAAHIPTRTMKYPTRWNPFAAQQLRTMLRGFDLIILHGNRAGELLRRAHLTIPTIAVAHSRFFTPEDYFSAIIALSPSSKAVLASRSKAPIYLVPNMIDVPAATPRAAWRTPPIVGAMGRFDAIKGYDLLIEALALVRAEFGDVQLHLGGDGAQKEALHALAKTNGVDDAIHWLGWVKDKTAFFKSIDIFCLSSRSETFPITLLEALAHGVPSVATDCGGPAAILAEHSGILTPITARGLADGLLQALRDPAPTARMGAAGYAHAANSYAFPVVATLLDETVRGLKASLPHPKSPA